MSETPEAEVLRLARDLCERNEQGRTQPAHFQALARACAQAGLSRGVYLSPTEILIVKTLAEVFVEDDENVADLAESSGVRTDEVRAFLKRLGDFE